MGQEPLEKSERHEQTLEDLLGGEQKGVWIENIDELEVKDVPHYSSEETQAAIRVAEAAFFIQERCYFCNAHIDNHTFTLGKTLGVGRVEIYQVVQVLANGTTSVCWRRKTMPDFRPSDPMTT